MAKVFLSAGHGGTDPGAVGNGLQEKNINLQIMLSCKATLESHGVKVVCSRTKDENDPVEQEVKEANASKADIAVSFHSNAGGGDGSESLYYPSTKNTKGKRLATLCEKYVKELGQNSRGVKERKNLMFLKSTDMPAIICECAFIDTKKDIAIADTVAEQKALGVAYAKAILEYFGIAYKKGAEWIKDNKGWWYKHADGSYTKNGWEKINNKWYYFNGSGYMVTGLQKIGKELFYFADDGHMCVTNSRGALV